MSIDSMGISEAFLNHVLGVLSQLSNPSLHITGCYLTISSLLEMSSHVKTILGSTPAVPKSHDAFKNVLSSGTTVYGVNTGFGGSAGARTKNHEQLQVALIQMLNSASYNGDADAAIMPVKWVRAAMLVRANTLLRGHSGVAQEAVDGILHLLNHGIVPIIPVLGSISASGDLTPLSYVVSTLQGNPTTMVYDHFDPEKARVMPADEALRCSDLSPLVCGPKEALAIVNGTAFSDAVGGLIIHDAMLLAMLAQILTAMAVEAICGHVESFDPYIAEVKNDEHQAEIARNIRGFLAGSNLAQGLAVADTNYKDATELIVGGTVLDRGQKLAQDRYALRTSAQWLSPPTQDILAAFRTMSNAINSTTDNPIVDSREPSNPRILNGGNFQGSMTASAMDKTRSALQLIGKLMFAQSTEVINPMTNNGLPPNLAASDPSMDFCCKGLDINIAAYQSELGWQSNPIGPHVQNAEMLNQSVNSLALISARKTAESISILQKMMASNLYIMCQAFDVRVIQERFFGSAETGLSAALDSNADNVMTLKARLWVAIKASWEGSGTYDLLDRVDRAVNATSPVLLSHYSDSAEDGPSAWTAFRSIKSCQHNIKDHLLTTYQIVRESHFTDYADATPQYLSKHTAAMYTFIRKDLRVPMFQGLDDNPTRENGKKAIGGYVGVIETALKCGKFTEVLGKAVRDVAGID
jgi:phenylalanine ammonia-lyase